MDDPNDLAKDIITGSISGTVGKVVDSKVAVSLLGPAATEIGDLMGQIASVAHFYATDNMARIFKRWAEDRKGKAVTEDEFKRVLPLLPTASLVSDEELQERWARLLEATATGNTDVLPSFGQTLSQLTGLEARYLDRLWRGVESSGDKNHLLRRFRELLHEGHPGKIKGYGWEALRVEADQFDVILSDILRLGIIQVAAPSKDDLLGLGGGSPHATLTALLERMEHRYTFSRYGERFMMAISIGTPNLAGYEKTGSEDAPSRD